MEEAFVVGVVVATAVSVVAGAHIAADAPPPPDCYFTALSGRGQAACPRRCEARKIN